MPTLDAPLEGISEIRRFFRTNETPIWFVSATAFNLLGIDRWVRNFRYVNYYDSFDGHHPNVFVPAASRAADLRVDRGDLQLPPRPQGGDRPRSGDGRRQGGVPHVRRGDGAARRARPASRSRSRRPRCATGSTRRSRRPGSATRRACRASRTSSAARDRTRSCSRSRAAPDLGDDLVVQTPYGDSGQTTFFIASDDDWDEHADELVDEELKVMKRIDCREAAIEGVITRHGTLVGPLMTELTGFPELTPVRRRLVRQRRLRDGALPSATARQAREYTQRMGERLRAGGLPRLLRARLPRRHGHAASCTSASSTRASPARAR